jgi:putative ABC transport system permease protein
MRLSEVLSMAIVSLNANKLRSGLTMFGITIGVFSIIGVMTIMNALQSSIESGLSFLGSNTFQIAKYPSIQFGGPIRDKYANRRDITYDEVQRLQALLQGQYEAFCPKIFNGGKQAVYGGYKTNPNLSIVGTNKDFLAVNQHNIELGRNLNDEDVEFARSVVVIGQDIKKRLFPNPNESPLDKFVKIGGKTYRVIGVLAAKGGAFGTSDDNLALIPITRYFVDYGKYNRSINVAIQAKSQAEFEKTMDKAIGAMRVVRGLEADEENDFEIYSNDSLISTFEEIAGVMKIGAFIISFIALITAGIGIMNIMLVSVTERTKEIGIRKSIGAKKKNILTQFLIEAVILSELGGIVGILLGVIGGNVGAMVLNATAVFPWDWAIIGLVVCSLIGIGFGFFPAMKAASLDPVEALRFE